jgi:prepilin signal peptidase PulO-like enzyme (type II secretory pathway)
MDFILLFFNLFVFLLGLCIGSFLNCFIYRLEKNKGLKGRSFCPHCKHTLNWKDLFPVFSFLFLSGRCRYCRKNISWQYPLVESATAVIFLLIFNLQFPLNSAELQRAVSSGYIFNFLNLAFLFYIASSLILIFIYDLKHFIIPDKVLFPAIVVALIYDLLSLYQTPYVFINYFIAILVSSGFFFLIFFVSGGKWMGFGDVKLCILLGLLLGLQNILLALFLAFFFGAIIGVILMVIYKKGLKSEIPFGPFLIVGTFTAMFWGKTIIQWYLNFFQV